MSEKPQGRPTVTTRAADLNPILDPAISKAAVDFVTSIRAAVVSVGMYPVGSKAVEMTSAKVSSLLAEVMKLDEKVTFSEFSGLLLVNGKQFDDKDKAKPRRAQLRHVPDRTQHSKPHLQPPGHAP